MAEKVRETVFSVKEAATNRVLPIGTSLTLGELIFTIIGIVWIMKGRKVWKIGKLPMGLFIIFLGELLF